MSAALIESVRQGTADEKSEVLTVLLRELIAAHGHNGPILVSEGPTHGHLAYVLPIKSEAGRQAVEDEVRVLAEMQERIDNPPDRFMRAEEFLAELQKDS